MFPENQPLQKVQDIYGFHETNLRKHSIESYRPGFLPLDQDMVDDKYNTNLENFDYSCFVDFSGLCQQRACTKNSEILNFHNHI